MQTLRALYFVKYGGERHEEREGKKVTGDDAVPLDALELLGDGGLRMMTQLLCYLHETGQWHSDLTEYLIVDKKTN